MPATHPLAARDPVHLTDLELPLPDPPSPEELQRLSEAIVARYGVRDLSQLLKLVELGEFITLLPKSVVARYPRPGIVYRDIDDAPPMTLAIAWPQQSRSTAVAALIRAPSAPTGHDS